MITYQDYEKAGDKVFFLSQAISKHRGGAEYAMAINADAYDRQANTTINRVVALDTGKEGATHIASNFFHRLNVQRCAYLLGNGVSFAHKTKRVNEEGIPVMVDTTKEKLGNKFDAALYEWGYKALIHGVAFAFWNFDHLMVYPVTQLVPFWDEQTGALRAALRFWRLEKDRPMQAEFYEIDGMTKLQSPEGAVGDQLIVTEAKRPYISIRTRTEAGEIVAEEWHNYPGLPVIPMWGSSLHQSTLVGLRGAIDAYDLIQSGFAQTLSECATIYWIIENNGGMDEKDRREFLRQIREEHIANVDSAGFTGDTRSALTPYTQEVPHQGASAYLEMARRQIYEDFGALDVHAIAAGSTNDHIDAAYQPMDEQADDFEFQVIEAVQSVLRLMGIEDTPIFKRNRISNVKEQVEAAMLMAGALDQETVIDLLPITVDQKAGALARLDRENYERFNGGGEEE